MTDSYRRFFEKAHGISNHYLACDLDEGTLKLWEDVRDYDYWPLVCSSNLDEQTLWHRIKEGQTEGQRTTGVFLSQEDIDHLEALLSFENIEKMRDIDDAYMKQKTGGWAYRDGWSIDFYAEGNSGEPPFSLKDIGYCSFSGDEEPFEEIIDYVHLEVLHQGQERLSYSVAKKPTKAQACLIAKKATETGLEAIEEILWNGCERIIRTLDEIEHEKELRYIYNDDCFTVIFGNMVSRACKLQEPPNCVSVYGNDHSFSRNQNLPQYFQGLKK